MRVNADVTLKTLHTVRLLNVVESNEADEAQISCIDIKSDPPKGGQKVTCYQSRVG